MPLDKEPTKYTDICIDLETWSLRPTAAIRSIGAVAFNIEGEADTPFQYASFYQNTRDTIGHRDVKTEEWWSQQSKEAQDAFLKNVYGLHIGLFNLMDFIGVWSDPSTVRVWSNGAGFDIPIIRNACSNCYDRMEQYVAPVWSYKNERDTRTLYWMAGGRISTAMAGVKHNALDDAVHEAISLRTSWLVIRNRMPGSST